MGETQGDAKQMRHDWLDWFLLATAALGAAFTITAFADPAIDNSWGMLTLAVAATKVIVVVVRVCVARTTRAFVHGYHAGWHDGTDHRCTGIDPYCDVLDLADGRIRRAGRWVG